LDVESLKRRRLRLAVVGLGKMGLLHASILNTLPKVQLVAFCDKSTLLSRLYRRIFSPAGISVVNDFEELSGLDLDAVYITTPISSHSFIAKNAFEKNVTRNIFVEKTLASNYEQARELCELGRDLGSITMVGYMKRFSVTFRKTKELLAQGVVGELSGFKAYAYSSDFLGLTKDSRSSAPRGGALRDLGCHVVDLALWLFGDLDVCDVMSKVQTEVGSETSVAFKARNSRGLEGMFDISQCMENYRMPEIGLLINGYKGAIEVNDDRLCLELSDGSSSKWYRHDLNDSVDFWLGESEYFREDQLFIESVSKNKKCEPNFDTASKVDYLIDQVRSGVITIEL
jgi:predicted dehydrogenase